MDARWVAYRRMRVLICHLLNNLSIISGRDLAWMMRRLDRVASFLRTVVFVGRLSTLSTHR